MEKLALCTFDSRILEYNRMGLWLHPGETAEEFLERARRVEDHFSMDNEIPESHWEWSRLHLQRLFDIRPQFVPACYSNRSLPCWEGAACWVWEGGRVLIQLRKQLSRGSYWGYERDEILAHEAVHAARGGLDSQRWEEFFAYMSSGSRWRQILGPIVRHPWEVWTLFSLAILSCFYPPIGLLLVAWVGVGFSRLLRDQWILRQIFHKLLRVIPNRSKVWPLLVRLTDREMEELYRARDVVQFLQSRSGLRWEVLRSVYVVDVLHGSAPGRVDIW